MVRTLIGDRCCHVPFIKKGLSLHYRSFGNKLFYSFLGIPYAKPPIASLRFNFSEPIEPWAGVFEADKHVPCLQVKFRLYLG